jgi:hypothetical protein
MQIQVKLVEKKKVYMKRLLFKGNTLPKASKKAYVRILNTIHILTRNEELDLST